MWVKNITDFGRFCYLNIPCRRIIITLIFMSSSSEKFKHLIVGKLENRCFCWYPAAMPSLKGTPTWLNRFSESRIWKIAQTWFLARRFVYLSSFISQILDVLYWMVCIFIFHCVTVQTENRDWSFAYFIGWKNLQYPWWSIVLVGFAECLSVSLNFSNNSWNKLSYISPSACWKISSLLATRQCPLKEKK